MVGLVRISGLVCVSSVPVALGGSVAIVLHCMGALGALRLSTLYGTCKH